MINFNSFYSSHSATPRETTQQGILKWFSKKTRSSKKQTKLKEPKPNDSPSTKAMSSLK